MTTNQNLPPETHVVGREDLTERDVNLLVNTIDANQGFVRTTQKVEPDRSKFPYSWEGPKPDEATLHKVINAYMGEQEREYDVYQFRYYLANWHHHYTLNQYMKAAVDAAASPSPQTKTEDESAP